MVMSDLTIGSWLNKLYDSGELCAEYKRMADDSADKRQLVDIAMDANGMKYLCEMRSKGFELPYDFITKNFAPYINGRYTATTRSKNGKGSYTSAIYCKCEHPVLVETTITTFLGCECDAYIKPNTIAIIYADSNCKITLHCPKTSRAYLDYWGNADIEADNNVKVRKQYE